MATYVILVLALISCAQAAPWRCYQAPEATICYGSWGQPCIQPHSINIDRPCPPCVGQATVFTPCVCPPPPPPCVLPPPPPPCECVLPPPCLPCGLY